MKVVWTRRVRGELRGIWLFQADRSVAYADRVRTRIIARGAGLGSVPQQGRILADGPIRLLSIPDVQYVLTYRIDADAIRILSVWSTAQDRSA